MMPFWRYINALGAQIAGHARKSLKTRALGLLFVIAAAWF